MLQEKKFKKLRNRAEKILEATRTQQNDSLSKVYIQELVRELTLYQIELELQDEELRGLQIELKESRNKYMALFDLAPNGYFILNNKGVIMEVNQAGAHLVGMSKQTLINKNMSRYISTDSSLTYTDYFSQLVVSSIRTCKVKLLKKHGSIFDVQLAGKIIINPRTLNKEILLMITDITDQKQDEKWAPTYRQKAAYLDRIGSMGELTSAMAHEINQPITIIGNYIHGSILRLEQGDITSDLLLQTMRKAAEQLQRASEIMLRMRNFVCKGAITHEPVCIDLVIQEALKLVYYEISEYPVKLDYRTVINPPVAMLDRIQIQQVILNLARNSIEAMKDTNTKEPSLVIELNKINTTHIEISIIDNGPGITQKIAHRLFDPYFTTKPYGIGVGLAVSRTIIESHGGKLLFESNAVYGACFKIILPIQQSNVALSL